MSKWRRVRTYCTKERAEWAAARSEQYKKEKAEANARAVESFDRCQRAMDVLVRYVEQHLADIKFDPSSAKGVIDLPLELVANLKNDDWDLMRAMLTQDHNIEPTLTLLGTITLRIHYAQREPEVVGNPWANPDSEAAPLTPIWLFFGLTKGHKDLQEVVEFDPTSTPKGKELLIILREAAMRKKEDERRKGAKQ